MIKKYLSALLEKVEGEKIFVASTDAIDRQGESIDQNGWQLENYKKHPIILAYHDQENPIGYAQVGFKTINGKKTLIYKPEFHGKTDTSRLYKELTAEGYPLASSVGFIPKEYDGSTITKAELLEISIVSVPANQEALSLAYSKGFDREVVKKAMPEGFEKAEQQLKNKEDENDKSVKEIKELKDKITDLEKEIKSLQEIKQPVGDHGREPIHSDNRKKQITRRVAIKALYKALEVLSKNERN